MVPALVRKTEEKVWDKGEGGEKGGGVGLMSHYNIIKQPSW